MSLVARKYVFEISDNARRMSLEATCMQGFELLRLKKERAYYPGSDHSTNELLRLCRLIYIYNKFVLSFKAP